MGFFSWLTGRDEKQADVYANFERVDDLVANLQKITTDDVTQAADAVRAAVIELNNVKGMAEFVGQINPECFDATFDKLAATLEQVGTMVTQKANDIKIYEESSWLEKIGSSFVMAGAKLGEGVLGLVEDLGDGLVSVVGWVAPKDSGVEKWCSDFVQKEWSHDTFNFYYKSDFAKASTFTEDSGLAGGFKLVGTVAAYCFGGGVIAGAGQAAAGAAKAGSIAARVAGAASRVASASTWGATILAGVAGMGSGTENALLNGAESFDAAAASGAKQGAIQATLAFAGGKAGEYMQKASAVSAANRGLTSATDDLIYYGSQCSDDAVRLAAEQADDALGALNRAMQSGNKAAIAAAQKTANSATSHLIQVASQSADDFIVNAASYADDAIANLATTSTSRLSAFQGLDDALSQSGRNVGRQGMQNVIDNGFVRGTMMNAQAVGRAGMNAAGTVARGVAQAPRTIVNGVRQIPNAVRNIPTAISNLPTTVSNAVHAIPGAITTAGNVVLHNPGVVAQTVNGFVTSTQGTENAMALNGGIDIELTGPTAQEMDNAISDAAPIVIPENEQFRMELGGGNDNPTPPPDGGGDTPYYPPDGGGDVPTTPEVETPPGDDGITPPDVPVNPDDGGGNPPVNPDGGYIGPGDGGSDDGTHSGGGFGTDEFSGKPFEIEDGFGTDEGEDFDSLGDIIASGDKLTKIPQSTKPIKTENDGVSAVIPIAAGLSAAAAAGIGAKVFMDRKNNSDNGEDDEFETDDWSDEGQIEIDYEDSEGTIADQYLNDEDDYGYHASADEKYGARSNEELAELQ